MHVNLLEQCMHAKSFQSCLALWNPMNGRAPGSFVHGILKARILKWFAILFSSGPHFVRTLQHDPSVLGGPTGMAHSFIELLKAVIHVIILASFL